MLLVQDSSVGIATRYGLDGPGYRIPCGGEIFRICPDRLLDPPSLLYNKYRVKSGRGVMLTPHPFWCRGHERLELYFYSPYGPYGLFRASVPVQGCTLAFFLLKIDKGKILTSYRAKNSGRTKIIHST
jgi:hypothetical protein